MLKFGAAHPLFLQGQKVHIRQIGPGMIQQMVAPCNECGGQGNIIPKKDWCKECTGQKTKRISQEFVVWL